MPKLSDRMTKLECMPGYKGKRPQTLVRLTTDGRTRFLDYLNLLENIVSGALSTAKPELEPPPNAKKLGWSTT